MTVSWKTGLGSFFFFPFSFFNFCYFKTKNNLVAMVTWRSSRPGVQRWESSKFFTSPSGSFFFLSKQMQHLECLPGETGQKWAPFPIFSLFYLWFTTQHTKTQNFTRYQGGSEMQSWGDNEGRLFARPSSSALGTDIKHGRLKTNNKHFCL